MTNGTPSPRAHTLQDFLQIFSRSNEETRQRLLTEVFQSGQTLQTRNEELTSQVESSHQRTQDQLAARQSESNAAMTELRRELARRDDIISDLNQRMAVAEFQLENHLQNNTPETSTSDKGKAVAKSEPYKFDSKFTGNGELSYTAFRRHVRVALAQNSDRYPTLQSQIALIYQNLGHEPQGFLDQYLQEDGFFNFDSIQAVWDVLDVSYRNLNEEEEARQSMQTIRQKNRPFGAFLADFQRLRNLSKIEDDKSLIAALRAGVSDEMRNRISQQQDVRKSYTFDEFVELCKECQIRLDLDRPVRTHNPIRP
ncbi:hypothetical protein K3495_g15976, partial [Podosphaera aphanis]